MSMSILNISKKINYPPSMVARTVIEHVVSFDGAQTNRRKFVTEAIRDPIGKLSSPTMISEAYRGSERFLSSKTEEESTIKDPFSGKCICHSEHNETTRLAIEVMEALGADPLYGPRFDKERNFVGVEYEIILEQNLRTMGKDRNVAIESSRP